MCLHIHASSYELTESGPADVKASKISSVETETSCEKKSVQMFILLTTRDDL